MDGYAEGIPEIAIRVELRSGRTAAPDNSWSRWKVIRRNSTIMNQPYVQLRVRLTSSNPKLSPALLGLKLTSRVP